MKPAQKVTCRIEVRQAEPREASVIEDSLTDTNIGNLRSKIGKWIDRQLISWSVDLGAVIKISIEPAELDEYANPER